MRLLIAEDEVLAQEGIRQLIPPEYDEIVMAGNGQDALVASAKLHPDVALCDIRMPKMNGIELAQQLRIRFPEIHILFLTAYSDKEYLKSAISVQADGYLEKPVDEEELVRHLKRIAEESRQKNIHRQQQNSLADLFARQQILRALLHPEVTPQEVFSLNPELTAAVRQAGYYLPVCIRVRWQANDAFIPYGFLSELKLAGMLEEISPDYLFAALSENLLSVLFYGDGTPSPSACRAQILPLLEAIRLANPQAISVCGCIGQSCTSLDALYSRYHRAHIQTRWMCFAGAGPCAVSFAQDRVPDIHDVSALFEERLHNRQFAEARQMLLEQTEELSKQTAGDIERIRQYYELLLVITLQAGNADPALYRANGARAEILSTFSRLSTLFELYRFICVRVDEISPTMNVRYPDTGIMHEIEAYLRQNLSDPGLSVQSAADAVGLSSNYLSSLCKRETGKTLHSVIVEMRMERAKTLLLNRYRVPEVAKRCGFTSSAYFYSVFRKQTGLSPAAFISQNRKRLKALKESGEAE